MRCPASEELEIVRIVERAAFSADRKTAMVLMLQSDSSAIQEIGELQTAYGALSLWSIA